MLQNRLDTGRDQGRSQRILVESDVLNRHPAPAQEDFRERAACKAILFDLPQRGGEGSIDLMNMWIRGEASLRIGQFDGDKTRYRRDLEISAPLQERFDPHRILFGLDRAGGVGQDPTGPQKVGRLVQQPVLQLRQPSKICRFFSPPQIGSPRQDTESRARNIEQNPVWMYALRQFEFKETSRMEFDIAQTVSRRCVRCHLQSFAVWVDTENPTLVLHQHGTTDHFPAGRRASIDDELPGLRVQHADNQAGSLILNSEVTVFDKTRSNERLQGVNQNVVVQESRGPPRDKEPVELLAESAKISRENIDAQAESGPRVVPFKKGRCRFNAEPLDPSFHHPRRMRMQDGEVVCSASRVGDRKMVPISVDRSQDGVDESGRFPALLYLPFRLLDRSIQNSMWRAVEDDELVRSDAEYLADHGMNGRDV